jgi:hypothetical protein
MNRLGILEEFVNMTKILFLYAKVSIVVNRKTFEGFVIEFKGVVGLYLNISLLASLIGETFNAVIREEFRNNII